MMDTNYLCEQKLKRENPQLHKRVADSVVCVERMLVKYQNIFPTYTDHTALHSINIIDFCNRLIGKNIDQMNADEIYVLLMGAYLHDSGMGITMSDYENFRKKIDFGDYFDTHDQENIPDIIRDFHQEFSGEYIKKYTEIFDIPSQEHLFAIVQVARGHRKTDLWDIKEYPEEICLPNGNKIHLPYLAALIRLADELDIAADRNLQFLYVENMHDVLLYEPKAVIYDFMWVQECGEIPSDLLPLDMEKNVLVFDLGGDNFDELLAADMLKRFEEINGIKVSIKRKEEVMCKLRKLAESRFITGL